MSRKEFQKYKQNIQSSQLRGIVFELIKEVDKLQEALIDIDCLCDGGCDTFYSPEEVVNLIQNNHVVQKVKGDDR